mgnify:CR=1 FL=1
MRKMIDVDFGSSRYDELVELRYKVLLEPLGLKFLDMYREKEMNYLHIGCVESLDDNLVGGLMLVPVNDEEIRLMQVAVDSKYQREGVGLSLIHISEPTRLLSIRLMQVAVDSKYQREGVGREMVKYAEKRAREAGYSRIVMHAMLSVVHFYEKLGYRQEGDIFEENGITFARMGKDLSDGRNFSRP